MAKTTHQITDAREMLRQCRQVLHGMESGLSAVIKGREGDFLALGEDLMSLQAGCEELATNAGELVTVTAGGSMQAGLKALSAQLTALTDVESRNDGDQSLAEIDGVARIVDELSTIVSAFSNIVKHLTMLGIATRIESARLGGDGRGFSTLADDVEKLAHLIVSHCADIATRVEALRGHVGSARERTQGIIKTQRQCNAVISEELDSNIAGLGAMTARSATLSQELSDSASAIAADIGAAVRSLQSHDIVRQQIEHVEHALAELANEIDTDHPADENNATELLAFAADVVSLQASQLDSAARHFSEAADMLRSSLASLSTRIYDIGHAVSDVATGSDRSNDTPLARLEAGVATVKSKMGDFASQGEALGGIMDSVAETISDMGGAIEAIEEVGAEIELIAINASIKAAHTGDAGAALGVLALAIQRLSADACRQTDAVARILGDISTASATLQENAKRYNDQSSAWSVVDELDTMLVETSAMAKRCGTLFSSLQSASHSLGVRAGEVARGIDFDRDIVSRLTSIRSSLEAQSRLGHQFAPEGGRGRSARLRSMYERYTMEAERAVHEAAFGLTSDVPAAQVDAAAAPSGEFGDNVELF